MCNQIYDYSFKNKNMDLKFIYLITWKIKFVCLGGRDERLCNIKTKYYIKVTQLQSTLNSDTNKQNQFFFQYNKFALTMTQSVSEEKR